MLCYISQGFIMISTVHLCSERWSLLSAKKRLSSHERGVCGLKIWDLAQIACRVGITAECFRPSPRFKDHTLLRSNGSSPEIQHRILNAHLSFLLWPPTVSSKSGKGCSGLKSETVKDRVGRRWGKPYRKDVLFEKNHLESKDNSVSVSFALEGHSKAAVTQQPQAWIIKTFL